MAFTREPMGNDCRNDPIATEYVVTPEGVYFESEEDALYEMVVGCGCGRLCDVQPFIVECLQQFATFQDITIGKWPPCVKGVEKLVLKNPAAAAEFIAHILTDRDLLEHGGSV